MLLMAEKVLTAQFYLISSSTWLRLVLFDTFLLVLFRPRIGAWLELLAFLLANGRAFGLLGTCSSSSASSESRVLLVSMMCRLVSLSSTYVLTLSFCWAIYFGVLAASLLSVSMRRLDSIITSISLAMSWSRVLLTKHLLSSYSRSAATALIEGTVITKWWLVCFIYFFKLCFLFLTLTITN